MAGVPKSAVVRVSRTYVRLKKIPVAAVGRPTRTIDRMVSAEIGAKRIIRRRTRSAIPRRNATERVSTVATAAPAMPSFGA